MREIDVPVLRPRVLGAVALAGSTIAVAACGGGGGGSTSTAAGGGSGPSGSFATTTDAICAQESAAEVAATRTPARSTTAAKQQVDALVAARRSALAKLRSLTPSSGQETAYRAFLAEWPAVETAWRGSVPAIAKGAAGYDAGGAAAPAIQASQTAAAKAGLRVCAGTLSQADAGAITALIRAGQLHPTPSICTQSTSKRFIAVTGGLQTCLQSAKTRSARVQISGVRGTPFLATARVTRSGGDQQAANLVFWLVKQGGRWQLDDAY